MVPRRDERETPGDICLLVAIFGLPAGQGTAGERERVKGTRGLNSVDVLSPEDPAWGLGRFRIEDDIAFEVSFLLACDPLCEKARPRKAPNCSSSVSESSSLLFDAELAWP